MDSYLVVKKLSPANLLYFMVGLLVFFILVRNSAAFLERRHLTLIPPQILSFVNSYLTVTRLSCMAIGGIGAYYYFYLPELIAKLISSTFIDVVVVALTLYLGATDTYIPYIMYEAYGVLFCYIILSTSCKASSILRFENSVWRWLGNLSYGIYMWQMVALSIIVLMIKKLSIQSAWQLNCLLYIGVLLFTILLSWISYNYIEKPFLRLKKKFVLINSKS